MVLAFRMCVRPCLLVMSLGACTAGIAVDGGTAEAELLQHVEELRQAELAVQVIDDFLPCGDEASAKAAATTTARPWQDSDGCFARIGWAPKQAVRGGYHVSVAADGSDFTVVGLADTDGDGTFQRVQASRAEPARVTTPPEIR